MGKPSRMSGTLIAQEAGVKPKQALMIGDRIETDVVCARRAGIWAVMVLTGISTLEEAQVAPDRDKPHWIVDSIAALPAFIEELEAGRRMPFDWVEGKR
jgi:NagD protein